MRSVTDSRSMTASLTRSPFVWGGMATAVFYGLVHGKLLSGWLIDAYFVGHPVFYVATALFFVGIAALAIKAVDVARQRGDLVEPLLGPIGSERQTAGDCGALLERLDRLSPVRQGDYIVARLRDALRYVGRSGTADTMEDHVKYLADLDVGRMHAGYGLVRLIVWAIPILGFLGTVIGIALAIANLSPQALEDSLPQVVAGLGVAFNTTTLALVLSIVLMFAQFRIGQSESGLLDMVDRRTEAELIGRFEQSTSHDDGQQAAIRRMTETLLKANDRLVSRQIELWRGSMETAQKRWAETTGASAGQLKAALSGALADSLKTHAGHLAAAERESAEQNRQHWDRVQRALVQSGETSGAMQRTVVRQSEALARAIEATGQVVKLEEALNRNLSALSGAANFEQTVMSLAAAIHLLNGRLAQTPVDPSQISLEGQPRKGHAA